MHAVSPLAVNVIDLSFPGVLIVAPKLRGLDQFVHESSNRLETNKSFPPYPWCPFDKEIVIKTSLKMMHIVNVLGLATKRYNIRKNIVIGIIN